jgi:hypothetical protein
MDELVERLTATVGIDKAVAEKAVGSILEFLQKEGPSEPVQALINELPGAEALIAAAGDSGGGLGGLLGGGLMALGSKLMGFGLGMSDIQNVARELFRFGREKIGKERIDEIVAGTPGLSQFT